MLAGAGCSATCPACLEAARPRRRRYGPHDPATAPATGEVFTGYQSEPAPLPVLLIEQRRHLNEAATAY